MARKKYTVAKKGDSYLSLAKGNLTLAQRLAKLNTNKLKPGQAVNWGSFYSQGSSYKPPAQPKDPRDYSFSWRDKQKNKWGQAYSQGSSYAPKPAKKKKYYGHYGPPPEEVNPYAATIQPRRPPLANNLSYHAALLDKYASQGQWPMRVRGWVADQLGYDSMLKESGYIYDAKTDYWIRPGDLGGITYMKFDPQKGFVPTQTVLSGGGGGGGGGGYSSGYGAGVSSGGYTSGRGASPNTRMQNPAYAGLISWRI